jgi:hypothetical protein
MHFIEQIFHIAPDGGTGTLELAIGFLLVMIPVALVTLRIKRLRRS